MKGHSCRLLSRCLAGMRLTYRRPQSIPPTPNRYKQTNAHFTRKQNGDQKKKRKEERRLPCLCLDNKASESKLRKDNRETTPWLLERQATCFVNCVRDSHSMHSLYSAPL